MSLFSLEILDNYTYEEIIGLSMIIILKIIEQLSPNNAVNHYIKDIIKKLELEKKTLRAKLQVMKNFTLEFDQIFPYVRNLQKFYSFAHTSI